MWFDQFVIKIKIKYSINVDLYTNIKRETDSGYKY